MEADKLVINGTFEGSANCEKIELLTDGTLIGNVLSSEFVIEAKAKFEGQSKIRKAVENKNENEDAEELDEQNQEEESPEQKDLDEDS